MAMKVTKTAIHRLSVDMSCGCKMYAEFEDAQCKKPIGPAPEGAEPDVEKIFKACSKHEKDASLSMLEFIISERLDEAIESAQKTPTHLHSIPLAGTTNEEIEEGDTGGVVASAGNVQTVAKVAKPAAVRKRQGQPPTVKTIQRSPEQLAKAGAAPVHVAVAAESGGAFDMQLSEAPEDSRITPHIEEMMDFLDPKESGLLDEGFVEDEE